MSISQIEITCGVWMWPRKGEALTVTWGMGGILEDLTSVKYEDSRALNDIKEIPMSPSIELDKFLKSKE